MRLLGFALVSLTFLAACKSKEPATAPAATLLAPSQDWLDGKLPPETGTPVDGGTLVVRVMNEPACLNFLADSCRDGWVARMTNRTVTQTLIATDQDGALRPELATAWTDSADHKKTTFTLRADATFSDGRAFTAKDVVATLDAVMDVKRPTGAVRGELAGLGAWKAIDDAHVELTWSSPSPFALRALSRLPILSATELTGDWTKVVPLGTGPFVLETWERGQAITLRRRPGGAAYLDTVVFRFVKDHLAAQAMFESGKVDLMSNLTPAFWRSLETPSPSTTWAHLRTNRIKSLDNSYSYIAWNEAKPFFADARVRRALAHLYDARLVSKVIDLDLELPTTCPYYRAGESCDPQVAPIPFSPSTARALLADAGFADTDQDGVLDRDGVPLRFTFLLPSTQVRLGKLVPMLQEQMKPLGIDLKIEKVEPTSLSARVSKRDFEVVSRLWTEFDREQDLGPMFHSSQIDGGSNWVGYSDAEVDTLIDQVRAEFDDGKRHALERKLHAKLYADQPYLFMTSRQSLDAAQKRVHGLRPSVQWYDLRAVWVSD